MTKTAAMPINVKNLLKSTSLEPKVLKLGKQHWGLKVYTFYVNDDPRLTLTYFTARSNLVTDVFEWRKQLQSH